MQWRLGSSQRSVFINTSGCTYTYSSCAPSIPSKSLTHCCPGAEMYSTEKMVQHCTNRIICYSCFALQHPLYSAVVNRKTHDNDSVLFLGGRWHDSVMMMMSGTSVPLGTLQMTFRTEKQQSCSSWAAAHICASCCP